ncbi:hypothetical protein ANN_25004 [Periplaneta americana]|uniref:Uncharacterized protein n=1 Tax=Periplaneta americana TaxID=6978 RepID=A0ABQ8S0A4_PERAM|nr:hypothetical protein ANN_25004 [Periplaneta americana]
MVYDVDGDLRSNIFRSNIDYTNLVFRPLLKGYEFSFHIQVMTNSQPQPIQVNATRLQYVEDYIYLGQLVGLKSCMTRDLKRRIASAWRAFWSLQFILLDKKLNRKLKLEVLQSCIFPTLLYGCQTWKLTVNQKTQIQICQRKMERKILGLSLRDKISNTRLKQMTNTRDMAHQGERLKWKWGGHVSRLQGCRWAHICTTWDPRIGRRNRGRPGTRWADFFKKPSWTPVVQNSQESRRMEIATVCQYRCVKLHFTHYYQCVKCSFKTLLCEKFVSSYIQSHVEICVVCIKINKRTRSVCECEGYLFRSGKEVRKNVCDCGQPSFTVCCAWCRKYVLNETLSQCGWILGWLLLAYIDVTEAMGSKILHYDKKGQPVCAAPENEHTFDLFRIRTYAALRRCLLVLHCSGLPTVPTVILALLSFNGKVVMIVTLCAVV